jgi:hypothetical protein
MVVISWFVLEGRGSKRPMRNLRWVLSRRLLGGTEENHDNLESE